MTERKEWYEDRGGHLYCKQDGVNLIQLYEVTGKFEPLTYECPVCKRKVMRS
jgi:hypothetical protein